MIQNKFYSVLKRMYLFLERNVKSISFEGRQQVQRGLFCLPGLGSVQVVWAVCLRG